MFYKTNTINSRLKPMKKVLHDSEIKVLGYNDGS